MTRFNRRKFIKTTAAASTAFPLFTIGGTKSSGNVLGANDTVRVGVAGIHGRGKSHYGDYSKMDKVDVSYLIDPDSSLFGFPEKTVIIAGSAGGTSTIFRTSLDKPLCQK